jgi:predicted aldo/keto reductase-like oxidoreductase
VWAIAAGVAAGEYANVVTCGLELGVNCFDLGFPDAADSWAVRACGDALRDSGAVTILRVNAFGDAAPDELERDIRYALGLYGLDRVTYIQIWGLNRISWPKWKQSDALARAQALREELAEGLTFYFTDDRFYMKPVIESGVFAGAAFDCGIMENSRDEGSYKLCRDYGMPVIACGVTKDGLLTENVQTLLGMALERPGICSVVAAPLTASEAEYLVNAAETAAAEPPGVRGMLFGKRIREAYRSKCRIQCELCRCCMPCPQGIDAPRIAELYNDYLMFGNCEIPAFRYRQERHHAERCTGCRKCVKKCPRAYDLPEIISDAEKLFKE